jgi:hypothetical protein
VAWLAVLLLSSLSPGVAAAAGGGGDPGQACGQGDRGRLLRFERVASHPTAADARAYFTCGAAGADGRHRERLRRVQRERGRASTGRRPAPSSPAPGSSTSPPDYLGLGDSTVPRHRHFHAATEASSAADLLELDGTDAGTLVWRADLTGSGNRPAVIALDARTGAVMTTPDD